MAAMRQQQLLQHQQQQARQAFMAQQAIQANMQVGVNGMPMGMQLSQLNPQQIQQLRQAGRIGPVSKTITIPMTLTLVFAFQLD